MDSGGAEPDRGFRIKNEAGAREGDAIRDTGAGLMQASGPLACHENARQRPFSKHDDRDGKQTAENAGGKRVVAEMIEPQPERDRRRELCIAAADPAAREQAEGENEHRRTTGEMPQNLGRGEAAGERHGKEQDGERDRNAIGNCHRQKIGNGGVDHQGWKKQKRRGFKHDLSQSIPTPCG